MKTLVIIPAYNEVKSIKKVLERLLDTCPGQDYIIVNDGSDDGTRELCEEQGYNLINHEGNFGLSSAVRTGVKYAIEHGYDAALQFDSDGQHLPEYIGDMIRCMEETGCDIVIASRYVNERMPFRMRTVGGKMISAAIRRMTGKYIADPTSGMRLFARKIMDAFLYNENLTPEPDTIAYFIRMGADVREIQVKMDERVHGKSYLSPVNAMKYMARVLRSILFTQKKWEPVDLRREEEPKTAQTSGVNS